MRKSMGDLFRKSLVLVLIVQLVICYFFFYRIVGNFKIYKYLKKIQILDDPSPNSLCCVSGSVKRYPISEKDTQKIELETLLEKKYGIKEIIWAYIYWRHSTGGKGGSKVTDYRVEISHGYDVVTPRRIFFQKGPAKIFSFREKTFFKPVYGIVDDDLKKISPKSTWVELSYFNPSNVFLMGLAGPISPEGQSISSRSEEEPAIVSSLSSAELSNSIMISSILMGTFILYFPLTFLVQFRKSKMNAFESDPQNFFVFNLTEGSEWLAILYFVLYGIFSWVVLSYSDPSHDFNGEINKAFICIGFSFLVHVSRSIEFFYVANKKDGNLYSISQGYFSFEQKKICPIEKLKIEIKGNSLKKQAYFECQDLKINLSDKDYYAEQLQEISESFKKFRVQAKKT